MRLAQFMSRQEVSKYLDKLIGGDISALCDLEIGSKEYLALQNAFEHYKRENKKESNLKIAISVSQVTNILEKFLDDPANKCDMSNLREALFVVYENFNKTSKNNISTNLKKLANILINS